MTYSVNTSVSQFSGVYIGAVTGDTAQTGITAAGGQWPALAMLLATIGAFFAGALISSYARPRLPHPAYGLVIMAGLVLAAQLVHSSLTHPLIVELPLLAVAMAMQGETVSRFAGLSIQTIVVTSNLLKLADGLVARYLNNDLDTGLPADEHRQLAQQMEIVLPACAWIGFALGAAAGALAASHLALPLLLPLPVLVAVASDMIAADMRRCRTTA